MQSDLFLVELEDFLMENSLLILDLGYSHVIQYLDYIGSQIP